MRDQNYLLIEKDTVKSINNSNVLNRLWFPHTPVVVEASASASGSTAYSGTVTVKIQEGDTAGGDFTDVASLPQITAAGKVRKRMLITKAYVKATLTGFVSAGHFEVAVVPAGEFTDPA